MKTSEFFNSHPVFSIDEAEISLKPPGGRKALLERLKYHQETGRLKRVARGVYAVIPPGSSADRFHPDTVLAASAIRPDGIFSYHSALELLGAAHSVFNQYTLFTDRPRELVRVNDATIRFMNDPEPFSGRRTRHIGTRRVERQSSLVETTGPERTLVEGFRRPLLAGGLEELIVSASGFATLDLDLLLQILRGYRMAYLWAATGWFLERFQKAFHVPDTFLEKLSRRRPKAPHYLQRNQRSGVFASRWNLMLPGDVVSIGGLDEP